jgi:hypothetical protein
MKKIALDVDGVMFDFMTDFDIAAAHVLGRPIVPQIAEDSLEYYNLSKRVQTTEDKVQEILQYMQDSRMYANLKPFAGVKEALVSIREAGFEMHVVTALPEHAKLMRLENLKNAVDFVPDEIHCVGMGMPKADTLRELMPDVFLDDRIEYLASAPFIYHLGWIDQKESQKDKTSMVDVHVHSLNEWVSAHMPRVIKKLDRHYYEEAPLQIVMKLENPTRKYRF